MEFEFSVPTGMDVQGIKPRGQVSLQVVTAPKLIKKAMEWLQPKRWTDGHRQKAHREAREAAAAVPEEVSRV